MKVLHVNTSDIVGGAARGAFWLHQALVDLNIDSHMLVAKKSGDDRFVYAPESLFGKLQVVGNGQIDRLPLKFYRKRAKTTYSTGIAPSQIHKEINALNPDIVNLHWVCGGFVSPSNLHKINAPIVWTLRDTWPFTGGCHYFGECDRYKNSCGRCPQLNSQSNYDMSRRLWAKKNALWKDVDLTLVGISDWIANCARESSLFCDRRIEVIHNAVNVEKFRPIPQLEARNLLGILPEKKVILFGAVKATKDKRKGFLNLVEALKILSQQSDSDDIEVVVFGSSQPESPSEVGMNITYLGHLHDDLALSIVYSSADVMIVPSLQEAFGKTAIEAMSCGVPIACFDSTGLKDIVEHKLTGYKARCFDSEDLSNGIQWILSQSNNRSIKLNCRKAAVERFSTQLQAKKYKSLYESVVS